VCDIISGTLVLHHSDCNDGLTAAWAVKKVIPDAEFIPVQHGNSPPDVAGKDIILVDFSYKEDVLNDLIEKSNSILLLDHHKTALDTIMFMSTHAMVSKSHFLETENNQRLIRGLLFGKMKVLLDMDRSGAGIAWDYFHPDEPRPKIIDHVEDGDLWRFAIPNTKEFVEAVRMMPRTFESIEQVNSFCENQSLYKMFIGQGNVLLENKMQEVEISCKKSQEVYILGHKVFAADVPFYRSSETANALIRDRPFGVTYYFDGETKKYHLSFRSDKNGLNFNVAELAEKLGGGGHKNASGAQVEILPWMNCGWITNDVFHCGTSSENISIKKFSFKFCPFCARIVETGK